MFRRTATPAFILVLAGASGAAAQSGGETAAVPPALPLGSTELVQVTRFSESDLLEVAVGPVDLPAGGSHQRLPIQVISFPVDGWLHGFEIEITDGDGNPLPSRLLHHINFIDPNHRELFSPIPRRVMAAGQETSSERMPWFLGYPIEADQPLLVSAMLSNELAEDFPEVYARVRFSYSLEGEGLFDPLFDVYPFYLDVMGPVGLKDFELPPGKTVRSWEGRPAVDGRILAIGGHVHDYADEIRLEDVTTGRVLWRAVPEADATGRTVAVPVGKLWWHLGTPIEADHTYRIVVEYTNPTEATIPGGGMGAIGGVAWVSRHTEWPELDRSDLQYVADLTNTLEAPEKLKHAHGHDVGAPAMAAGGMSSEGGEHSHATVVPAAEETTSGSADGGAQSHEHDGHAMPTAAPGPTEKAATPSAHGSH